jgi:hypothetical protein
MNTALLVLRLVPGLLLIGHGLQKLVPAKYSPPLLHAVGPRAAAGFFSSPACDRRSVSRRGVGISDDAVRTGAAVGIGAAVGADVGRRSRAQDVGRAETRDLGRRLTLSSGGAANRRRQHAGPGTFSLRPIIRVGLACGDSVNRLMRATAVLEPVGCAVLRKGASGDRSLAGQAHGSRRGSGRRSPPMDRPRARARPPETRRVAPA